MILQVFAVYDKAVQAFMPPFYVRSKGEAIRSFTEAVNDEKHNFSKHAADYSLMQIGEFDDHAGSFATAEPTRVITALEAIFEDPLTPESNVTKMPRVPM